MSASRDWAGSPLSALSQAPVARGARIADQVYRHLRRAIVSGEIEPGTRMREVDIAASLNVSRTPVREAISRLLGDWLVRELPTNGVEVVDTANEMTDIIQIRQALETASIRLAATRITSEQLNVLDDLVEKAKTASFKERIAINQAFHMTIAEASGSARLMEMILGFREHYLNPRWVTRDDAKIVKQAQREHRQIVVALRKRDPDGAEAIMRQHLKLALTQLQYDVEGEV